jgi:AcrR family transcriptional regulator
VTGKPRIREDLTAAAIALFLEQGYDETTVDAIAEAAGVARRTFFRYFRTKEDAVFPDHDDCLQRVEELLNAAAPQTPPLAAVGQAAQVVLAMYTHDPATAVKRYELTRSVAPLREREITATSRYQRVFTDHLHKRSRGDEDSRLRDEVVAAAVVAAHNHVLRHWLRAGGKGDPRTRLDVALGAVTAALGGWLEGRSPTPAGAADDVVVVAVRRGTPMWRVVQEIEATTLHP